MRRNDSWPAMAAVLHVGCLKEVFHTLGDSIFYLHTEFSKDILIGGGDMPPKLNRKSKQHPLAAEF